MVLGVVGFEAFACPGDKRGFLSAMHVNGGRTIKAWMETSRRELLFFAIDVSNQGLVTRICSEPNPVSVHALASASDNIDALTTRTWNLLLAKGHGRLLMGFWDTEEGIRLAESSERGQLPPSCK